jgi:hypothetical protein
MDLDITYTAPLSEGKSTRDLERTHSITGTALPRPISEALAYAAQARLVAERARRQAASGRAAITLRRVSDCLAGVVSALQDLATAEAPTQTDEKSG